MAGVRLSMEAAISLTIINPANSDTNSWAYKDSWRASAYVGGFTENR